MNLVEVVRNLRINHNLHGKYPVVIFTMPNKGGVSSRGKRYYVLTYREKENDLYFHGLTRFFKRYDKSLDFSLRIDKFKFYNIEKIKIGGSKFSLISYKNDYFPFGYFSGLRDSVEGENNLQYIIDELTKKGIQYTYKLESDFKNAKK